MKKQKKQVLVTGGAGFIGSNLVRELNNRGHDVWLCDLMHSEKERFIRCDVSKYHQVERMFDEHDFDYVPSPRRTSRRAQRQLAPSESPPSRTDPR